MKTRPEEPSRYAGGQTDRHDEPNSRFSNFGWRA
jgi:hypothetical protein